MVLVEPQHPGNVGAVARVMSNFAFTRLLIVSEMDFSQIDDARRRAMHGISVLESAEYFKSFHDLRERAPATRYIGTTGKTAFREGDSIRIPIYLRDLDRYLDDAEEIGLVFGREDRGLFDSELAMCNILLTIPTAVNNPILNLSHAVGVVLHHIYEISGTISTRYTEVGEAASALELEQLNTAFAQLMDAADYREFKKDITLSAFSRVMGRAGLSKWEFYRIIGVLTRARKMLVGDIPREHTDN